MTLGSWCADVKFRRVASGAGLSLLSAGILDRADDGGVVFPFDAVRVEFTLRAA